MARSATPGQVQAVADLAGVRGVQQFVVKSLDERNPPGWRELGAKQWAVVGFLVKKWATKTGDNVRFSGDAILFLSRLQTFPAYKEQGATREEKTRSFWKWANGALMPWIRREHEKWQAGGKLQLMFEQEYAEGGNDGDGNNDTVRA